MTLESQLKKERIATYIRLRGGYSVPLAGAIYWVALGILGYMVSPEMWSLIAFVLSGAIFPLALLLSKLLHNDFMNDRTATSSIMFPAFMSMLLFWPIAIAAMWTANEITPLVLAIGMSIHWPVIGWSYGRVAPYMAHAILRAVTVFGIWQFMPDARFTLLPLSVAFIYLLTVAVILIDSSQMARRVPLEGSAE